ncbi:MAG: cell division protein FtsL [Gammaproteobacteria bacterium]|jgi:cell division protein FtsL|nr:cell division protein FtsL [Gammaproteobacteria bacterium]MDH3887088.1 cell division protein FtsL [Gammaproteobacteria bacterium]MDH3934740.1 cell division protein FtsL [Gammaproteobacteria bacterium]MDH3986676.1 cell division protein FtsL [Gammaproteobacteria bacterium]
MSARPLNLLLMLLLVVVSAIAIVYSKHSGRELFIELQALANERDAMDVEWGQLQLEQSTLTTQGQVERDARDKLGMVNLAADNMVIVKP